MKIRKDNNSPWKRRIYFEEKEFELMMDELRRRAGDGNFAEGKGIDVDMVLLRSFDVEADYARLPDDVLGRVLFTPEGRVEIQISRQLADEAETNSVSRRRLRTTLGHECGHIVCHRQLFLVDTGTLSLFGERPKEEPVKILCRNSIIDKFVYRGEWWEYQANQCMVELLLPRKLFVPKVREQLDNLGVTSFSEVIEMGHAEHVIRNLADIFDVSQISTLFRLKSFGFVPDEKQIQLGLS